LFVSGWFYSCEKHIADLWTYVAPAFRQSNHAKDLLDFAKRAADRCGYPLLAHQLVNDRTVEKAKLLERRLGGDKGVIIIYRPTKKDDAA